MLILYTNQHEHTRKEASVFSDVDGQWQADLVDMLQFSKHNNAFNDILTAIDILFKYAWALGPKDRRVLTYPRPSELFSRKVVCLKNYKPIGEKKI